MFNKILIANRGEIAVRIIRACKEMGIKTVAVYSEADKDSIHIHMADQAICIGPAKSKDSYLNIDRIISAAIISKADGIHPGYGFLSESDKFAKACKDNNIVFIGPKIEHINMMGNKSTARDTMIKNGVPVVPGSQEATNDPKKALGIAKEIGFPVMVKASNGGGGKGMRVVRNETDFIDKFNMAKSEAQISFNDDSMYIEKLVENPRHIEFQILGDDYGNIIHLGERDCSIQRRNQKVIEEAPCNIIDEKLREEMGKAAIKAGKAVNYLGAGTIEFLLDKDHKFYFIEMNTRVQVEHPITEMITGVDIIKKQIEIAFGKKLDIRQEDVIIKGHSIECRINAEDPANDFRPSPGKIQEYFSPGGYGVRIDSHIYNGYTIPSHYDSMIGKLIVWANNREEAISKMNRALDDMVIIGINTNIDFQKEILNNKNFIENKIDTSFIESEILNRE